MTAEQVIRLVDELVEAAISLGVCDGVHRPEDDEYQEAEKDVEERKAALLAAIDELGWR